MHSIKTYLQRKRLGSNRYDSQQQLRGKFNKACPVKRELSVHVQNGSRVEHCVIRFFTHASHPPITRACCVLRRVTGALQVSLSTPSSLYTTLVDAPALIAGSLVSIDRRRWACRHSILRRRRAMIAWMVSLTSFSLKPFPGSLE